MNNADALIISMLALSWLCGAVVAYVAITVYSAIRHYEKEKEVPGEDIDFRFEYSEQPYICGQ